jgi:hypothetical protein
VSPQLQQMLSEALANPRPVSDEDQVFLLQGSKRPARNRSTTRRSMIAAGSTAASTPLMPAGGTSRALSRAACGRHCARWPPRWSPLRPQDESQHGSHRGRRDRAALLETRPRPALSTRPLAFRSAGCAVHRTQLRGTGWRIQSLRPGDGGCVPVASTTGCLNSPGPSSPGR